MDADIGGSGRGCGLMAPARDFCLNVVTSTSHAEFNCTLS
jgi:hypothetical protein